MAKVLYIVYSTEIDRTKIRENELTPSIELITEDEDEAYAKLDELKKEFIDRYGEEEIYDSTDDFVYDLYRATGIVGVLKEYIE